jgi:hypothetical protein
MFPVETRRAFSMIGKSKTFAMRIVGHALWLGVTDALLTSTLKWNWVRRDPNLQSKEKDQSSSETGWRED